MAPLLPRHAAGFTQSSPQATSILLRRDGANVPQQRSCPIQDREALPCRRDVGAGTDSNSKPLPADPAEVIHVVLAETSAMRVNPASAATVSSTYRITAWHGVALPSVLSAAARLELGGRCVPTRITVWAVTTSGCGAEQGASRARVKLDVPAVVRCKARAAGAGRWLLHLPGLVASLEQEWSLAVGRSYGDATEAYVAEATLGDGTPAVLKLLVPRDGRAARDEITVLRLTDGEGCVRLLRADVARGALLLERLGRSLHELALPARQRHKILCSAAARGWRPAPGCGLPTGAGKVRGRVGNGTRAARPATAQDSLLRGGEGVAPRARLRSAHRGRQGAMARRLHYNHLGGTRPPLYRTRYRACARLRRAPHPRSRR